MRGGCGGGCGEAAGRTTVVSERLPQPRSGPTHDRAATGNGGRPVGSEASAGALVQATSGRVLEAGLGLVALEVLDRDAPSRRVGGGLGRELDVRADLAEVRGGAAGRRKGVLPVRDGDGRDRGAVDVIGGDLLADGRHVGLRGAVLGLLALRQEDGDRDRGEDADDDHDDEELNEGEAALALLLGLADASEHVLLSFVVLSRPGVPHPVSGRWLALTCGSSARMPWT